MSKEQEKLEESQLPVGMGMVDSRELSQEETNAAILKLITCLTPKRQEIVKEILAKKPSHTP